MVIRKSISTPLLFIILMTLNMGALAILILPCKQNWSLIGHIDYNYDCMTWFYADSAIFSLTILFFSLSSFVNPGYIEPPEQVSFMVIIPFLMTGGLANA